MNVLIRFRRSSGPVAGIDRSAQRIPGLPGLPSVRALGLALAVVLLASLLAPLAGGGVAADEPAAAEEVTPSAQDGGAGEDPTTGGGDGDVVETPAVEETPVAQETPTPGETPATPAADETPLAEETPDTGTDALQGNVYNSGISVSIWLCGADHGADLQQYFAQCQADVQIPFGISGEGVFVAGDAIGHHTATGLPATRYTIREELTPYYREPAVFCGVAPTGEPVEVLPVAVATTEGRYTFDLGPNESIVCHWFNIPKILDTGELWLYKHICPETPRIDYYGVAPGDLQNRCELYGGEALAYSLYSPVSGLTEQRDIRPDLSAYVWKDVPAGEVTITELGWNSGAPLLYCATYPGDPNWFKVDVHERSGSFSIPSGLNMACHWYSIPTGIATVTINHHLCPAGFDAGAADIYGLAQRCDGREAGITFGAYSGHATLLSEQTTGDSGVRFVGLPSGDIFVTEEARQGYGQPRVFCKVTKQGSAPSAQQEVTVGQGDGDFLVGSYIGWHFDPGDILYCDWFDIPNTGDGAADPDLGSDPDRGEEIDPNAEDDSDSRGRGRDRR